MSQIAINAYLSMLKKLTISLLDFSESPPSPKHLAFCYRPFLFISDAINIEYMKYPKLTERETEEIIKLLEKGLPRKRISAMLGIPYHQVIEADPENRRRIREKQRSYRKELKYGGIDYYLEIFREISLLSKNNMYFEDSLRSFLKNPYSIIIMSIEPDRELKLKTIKKCVEEECNGEDVFERDSYDYPKVTGHLRRLVDRELVECKRYGNTNVYSLSEKGEEIYRTIKECSDHILTDSPER